MANKKTWSYTDEQLNAANAQIKYGDLSTFMYGVPKATSLFRIKNPASSIGTGTVTILSTFTELTLVKMLIKLAGWGFGSRKLVLELVAS